MKTNVKILFSAILFLILPVRLLAQKTSPVGHPSTIEFDITNISNFDQRIFFLYNLLNDTRFEVITSENDGYFVISANETFENLDLEEAFADFREQNAIAFSSMDKEQAAEVASEFKAALPYDFTMSLRLD